VEAAIAMLVGESSGPVADDRRREGPSVQHTDEMDEAELARERRRRRRQGPTRANLHTEDEERPRPRNARGEEDAQAYGDVSAQADKILAQASEIGMNVFSKANSLWSQGKERAQKLYEERQAAFAAAERANGNKAKDGDGRPRWMIDAEEAQAERQLPRATGENAHRSKTDSFKDSDDDDEGPEDAVARKPPPPRIRQRPPPAEIRPDSALQPNRASEPKVGDLFGESAPVYRSAGRRKPVATPEPRDRASPSAGPSRPTPARSPAPLITRPVEPIASNKVAESAAKKNVGNEHFKLGKFGEASDAYTAALGPLPSGHLLTVPLFNNRAAARIKQGDHTGAIADTSQVITMVGLDYHPAKETPLMGDLADVKLPEALFKALSKRASAYEMAERWTEAREDWECLMGHAVAAPIFTGVQGANQRKLVSDGLARSRKMASSGQTASNGNGSDVPKPKARPTPPAKKAPVSTAAFSSKNVAKMREQAAAQETEDAERLDLKAGVDAKVQAWSGGKETNLRGLLSSLDMVLWEGLGVKKPSMAELITEKQVKIGYMRVIGRLHPDKVREYRVRVSQTKCPHRFDSSLLQLNASNATVEQRMIANSVFGILNEAYVWPSHV
jgi:tetratricopeptide (TPR) repeat protein